MRQKFRTTKKPAIDEVILIGTKASEADDGDTSPFDAVMQAFQFKKRRIDGERDANGSAGDPADTLGDARGSERKDENDAGELQGCWVQCVDEGIEARGAEFDDREEEVEENQRPSDDPEAHTRGAIVPVNTEKNADEGAEHEWCGQMANEILHIRKLVFCGKD